MRPIITLTTDFGHQDAFVGTMKGVILTIAPHAHVVDICHAIPPQDLVAATLQLEAALPYFPDGTIHLIVVDPGVGTERAAIAVETRRGFLVGPDNGVIPAAMDGFERVVRTVRLTNTRYHLYPTSRTFHGRDIFAPVAAHLAAGVPLGELGEPWKSPICLPLPQPIWEAGHWRAHVISRDRFGNLVTDVKAEHLETFGGDPVEIYLNEARIVSLRDTFGDVAAGETVAYIGSSGRMEIAVRNGSAAEKWGSIEELTVGSTGEFLSPE